jgi:hypothetical protein
MSKKGIAVGVGVGALAGAGMGAAIGAVGKGVDWKAIAIGAAFGALIGGATPPLVGWSEMKFAAAEQAKLAAPAPAKP